MKKITKLQIDTSEMPTAETSRSFKINGEIGAEFILYILQNPSSSSTHTLYYDFNSNAFESGHNDINNNLRVVMTGKNYYSNIVFPSGGGSYTIKLLAVGETEIVGLNKHVISQSIEKQSSDATVTFQAATTNTSNYATFPTVTTSGPLTATKKFDFDWAITNASTDSHGFGLRLATTNYLDPVLIEKSWYFETTETVDGAIDPTDSNGGLKVQVDDLTDIGLWSYISGVSAGSLSGTPYVSAIDTSTKTLTLTVAQTFADGITLTFRSQGTTAIQSAIGCIISFNSIAISGEELFKTVRADGSVADEATDGSNVKIALEGTYGLAGGGHVIFKGEGVDNSTATTISTITTPSSSAGLITVSRAQSLEAGTVLKFGNVHQVINITGSIKITNYPSANKTINFDLDPFITVGAAS